MADLSSPFPPIGSTCHWRQPVDGHDIRVRAVAKRWRPSGQMRVYTFEVDGRDLVGVVDYDPDRNLLTVVPFGVAVDHAFPIETVKRPSHV